MSDSEQDDTLEGRYAEARRVAAEAGGEVHVTVVVGGVDVSELYRITPIKSQNETLDEELAIVEAILDDPRFAEVCALTKQLKDAEDLVGLVKALVESRGQEYNAAIAAFRAFALSTGTPSATQSADTMQSVIRMMVEDAVAAHEREQAAPKPEPSAPEAPDGA